MAALDAAPTGAEAGPAAMLAADAAANAGSAGSVGSAACKAVGGEVAALDGAGVDGSGNGAFAAMPTACGLAVTGDSDPAKYFRPKPTTAIAETAANSNTPRFEGVAFGVTAAEIGGETGGNAFG